MNEEKRITVIGLGYVGLPLAVALAQKFPVIGFDVDSGRVAELLDHRDRTGEITSDRLKESTLTVTDDETEIAGQDIYIVTVPTPVDAACEPDLTAVRGASALVGRLMKPGAIVVYESTVYPGVTEDIAGPELEKASGLVCGKDFFLGYSPERINPGDREHTVDRITKVVAGQTPEVTKILEEVYSAVTSGGIFIASDIRTAEAAKVIENAQRDINIAFANEVTMIFQKMGLSVYDVLEAAGTKWNFLNFTPGLVGGHCIGVDPFYLAHAATAVGHHPDVVLAGRRTNDGMGQFIAERISARLAESDKRSGAKILMLGLTFKENVPDLRNTRVIDVIRGLEAAGHNVAVHDDEADPAEAKRLFGLDLVDDLSTESGFDCIVGAVPHDRYKSFDAAEYSRLLVPGGLIADIKGMWRTAEIPEGFARWQL